MPASFALVAYDATGTATTIAEGRWGLDHCYRGLDSRSGDDAVVDEDDHSSGQFGTPVTIAIELLVPGDLALFALDDLLHENVGQPECIDERFVNHPDSSATHGAYGHLIIGLSRKPANDRDIEWSMERLSDLEGDRHAPAGQRQNDHIRSVPVCVQLQRKFLARLRSISKWYVDL